MHRIVDRLVASLALLVLFGILWIAGAPRQAVPTQLSAVPSPTSSPQARATTSSSPTALATSTPAPTPPLAVMTPPSPAPISRIHFLDTAPEPMTPRMSWSPVLSADGRFVAFATVNGPSLDPDRGSQKDITPDIFVYDRQTGQISLVSVASDGRGANFHALSPSISADGRFVAFESMANNLVPDDTNECNTPTTVPDWCSDIFVHDRETGQISRVSLASAGTQADADSRSPAISADGRFVAFESMASNLVPGATNACGTVASTYDCAGIFVHDRQTGQTALVSSAHDDAPANGSSGAPSLSADGRFVAFESEASNLVPGVTAAGTDDCEVSQRVEVSYQRRCADIFVYDRETGQITHVSVASDGTPANSSSRSAAISADGRYVTFASLSSNLVPGDTNESWDIFVHDRETGQTSRVSLASAGTQADAASMHPTISANGRLVVFASEASNLVSGATGARPENCAVARNYLNYFPCANIFVHDRETGQTRRLNVAADGTLADPGVGPPAISADGHLVAFASAADNLVPDDTIGTDEIFLVALPAMP